MAGVLTLDYSKMMSNYADLGTGTTPKLSYFKIGEAGWFLNGLVKTPKVPLNTLTTIESSGTAPEFSFQKSFQPADVVSNGDGTVTVICRLEAFEANDDGLGQAPEFFELGIYDQNNVMIAYMTFPGEVKTNVKPLQHSVTISFI